MHYIEGEDEDDVIWEFKINEDIGFLYLIIFVLSTGIEHGLMERIRLNSNPQILSFMFWINLFSFILQLIPVILIIESPSNFLYHIEDVSYSQFAKLVVAGFIAEFLRYLILLKYGALASVTVFATENILTHFIIGMTLVGGGQIPARSLIYSYLTGTRFIGFALILVTLLVDLIFGYQKFESSGAKGSSLVNEVELKKLNVNNGV